jgi:PKD repeat protein
MGLSMAGCAIFNRAPTATFTASPSSGDAPLSVFFDGRHSSDSDGRIVSYSWAFGDGASGEGETITHTYGTPGTFRVTLSVADDRGTDGLTQETVVATDPAIPPETGIEVGQSAPAFSLKSFDGSIAQLADYRGLVVLLSFWRSTCSSCRSAMPQLESLRATYDDRGLVVVTVNLDESESEAEDYLAANGYDAFIVLRGTLAEATAVRELYEVDRIPYTYLIDRQGIVRHADHPIRLRAWQIEPWL